MYHERRLAEAHDRYFLESARIDVDTQHFIGLCFREIQREELGSIAGFYKCESCICMDSGYHVPAAIGQEVLSNTLLNADSSVNALLSRDSCRRPKLTFPSGFWPHYLHGRHRIEAGRQYLRSHDHWWVVDLHVNGKALRHLPFCLIRIPDLSVSLRTVLMKQTSNKNPMSTGEIYYHILRSNGVGRAESAQTWCSRVQSSDEKRELKRLPARPHRRRC